MKYLLAAMGVLSLALFFGPADAQRPPDRGAAQAAQAPGWIGITYSPLRGSQVREGEAAIVNGVHTGSPAQRAGIRPGDTIVRVNGRTDVLEQMRALRLRPGDTMRLRVRRADERDRDVTIVAAEGPPDLASAFDPYGLRELPAAPTWSWFSTGWLGISHPALAAAWPPLTGAFPVTAVHPGSPAARAGIQPGDTIVRVNGRTDAAEQMSGLRLAPGDTVRLRVRRSGERERDLTVVAAERPTPRELGFLPGTPRGAVEVRTVRPGERIVIVDGDTIRFPVEQIVRQVDSLQQRLRTYYADTLAHHVRRFESEHLPQIQRNLQALDSALVHRLPSAVVFETGRRAIAGAEFSDLNPDLAAFFEGASEGVLVLRVGPESPAARAGLRAGDVVTQVNGNAVRTTPELRTQVIRARGEEVTLRVVRRGRPLEISLP